MKSKRWLRRQAYAIAYLRLLEALDNGRVADDCLNGGLDEQETRYICGIIHQLADQCFEKSHPPANRGKDIFIETE